MPFLINTLAHVEIMSDLLAIWQNTEANEILVQLFYFVEQNSEEKIRNFNAN